MPLQAKHDNTLTVQVRSGFNSARHGRQHSDSVSGELGQVIEE